MTAQCRAGEVMTGREAGLDVMAYGADFSAGNSCEDAAPLAAEMVLSCTVEDPVPPRRQQAAGAKRSSPWFVLLKQERRTWRRT